MPIHAFLRDITQFIAAQAEYVQIKEKLELIAQFPNASEHERERARLRECLERREQLLQQVIQSNKWPIDPKPPTESPEAAELGVAVRGLYDEEAKLREKMQVARVKSQRIEATQDSQPKKRRRLNTEYAALADLQLLDEQFGEKQERLDDLRSDLRGMTEDLKEDLRAEFEDLAQQRAAETQEETSPEWMAEFERMKNDINNMEATVQHEIAHGKTLGDDLQSHKAHQAETTQDLKQARTFHFSN